MKKFIKKFICLCCFLFAGFCVLYLMDEIQKYNRNKHIVTVTCDFNPDDNGYEATDVSGLSEEEINKLLTGGE